IWASHILQKMTAKDNVEAYLLSFERAEQEGWPKEQWAGIVAPFPVSNVQKAYFDLEPNIAADYTLLNAETLAQAGVIPTIRAQRFHSWTYSIGKAPQLQMFDLIHLACQWLQLEVNTPTRIVELIVMDKYLRALPLAIRKWVGQGEPANAQELIALVERQVAAEELLRAPVAGTRRNTERLQAQEEGSPGGKYSDNVKRSGNSYQCYKCNELRHIAIQCPNTDEPMEYVTSMESTRPFLKTVKINGKETMALTDLGSTVTLVSSALVRPSQLEHTQKTGITCVHGDIYYYPTTLANFEVQGCTYEVKAGVVPKLPYPVIIGQDFPG
uniref:CCHC-type domain-containing protein n=1 Tax=Latimeria chalumnae TaxID=7897 RepID=H3AC01_LATCH